MFFSIKNIRFVIVNNSQKTISMRILFTVLFLSLTVLSCTQSEDKAVKKAMDASFHKYIKDNDIRKDLVTKLRFVSVLSYKELSGDPENPEGEKYEATVYMQGTSGYSYSAKIYNIDDTVTCYFDKDLNMLRLVKPETD